MTINYLFPHFFKKVGWVIFLPTLVFGFIAIGEDINPEFLDIEVYALFTGSFLGKDNSFSVIENNFLNEILGLLMIVSLILIVFSKEKDEDELISKIRFESLVWAIYVNYAILALSMLLVYEIAFLWVMIFNMFTILFFYIVRFNLKVWKLRKMSSHEE